MTFAEVKDNLAALSPAERSELLECLQALEEGMDVAHFRAMNAAIEKALAEPGPGVAIEEVRKRFQLMARTHATAA